MSEPTRVQWRSWDSDAFAEARQTDTPILLSLTVAWSKECQEMDTRTYAEPRIAANVNDRFVPVRVDADRHPRVRERYAMGGFPTVAFLTPDGKLLTGATYVGPEGFRKIIERVRDMWRQNGADAGRVPRSLADNPTPRAPLDAAIEEHLAGQLTEQFDREFGGWGTDAKFPLPRTIEFALKRERETATRTLDAIESNLFDSVAGGFFRFAGNRDWTDVRYEKTIEDNAGLLSAFANGYLYTGEERYRETAAQTIEFLTDELWTGVAVGGSLGPGQGASYYAADAEERESLPGPQCDLTVFAGGNALVVDALLTYHAYTDDERARTYADRILTAIETDLLEDDVVVRFDDGTEQGERLLLTDTARVISAFVSAQQVLGDRRRVEKAAAIADRAIEELFVDGTFLDGPSIDVGMLDRPLRPLDGTVEMADALYELSVLTGDNGYESVAREAIEAFGGAWDRMGVHVAGYGSIAHRLLEDPLVVEIGGPAGTDLHRAALRIADHDAIIVPDANGVAPGEATVRGSDDVATHPDELLSIVADRLA